MNRKYRNISTYS